MMPTRTIATYDAIEPLEKLRPDLAVIVGASSANGAIIAQGDVLGAETETGLYRRRTLTNAAGAGFATNSKTGEVADAVFLLGDTLTNNTGQAIGTVQSVTGNFVTLAANASVAVAAGARVQCVNGAEKASGISDTATDGVGVSPIAVFIAGLLTADRLRGLDAAARADLGGVEIAGIFKF